MKFLNTLLFLQSCAVAGAFTFVNPSAGRAPTQLYNVNPVGNSPGYTSKTADWEIEKISPIVKIQGTTRHTWNFNDINKEIVQVALETGGRPMNCDIQLWIGPDWTPVTMKAYSEDGQVRPIQSLVGTRNKSANLEIRNTASSEFPLSAACSYAVEPLADARIALGQTKGDYIEGKAIYTKTFGPEVGQVQVMLETDGRMLNAKVELLNGPNNVKQAFEIFTNNGKLNSLFVVFDTPGEGNVVRVTNLAPLEFPCTAYTAATKSSSESPGAMTWN
uniref:Uncharacterized protein n=1 Tax=Ditylum brightwellii TaxID=49249 RepID=A0A7S4STG9_9STRA|mmetsp:Transcript_35584/g.47129  ORF Transcript_35584/g.47129 Transcript_35584/m.47129 type:complete len:275 (+) Transcript_35584:96-920(+)